MLTKWTLNNSNNKTIIITHLIIKLSILLFLKCKTKTQGLQGIRSLMISFQEPSGHECGSSFTTTKTQFLIDTPFPSYTSHLEVE
jgi:hypothetical protein